MIKSLLKNDGDPRGLNKLESVVIADPSVSKLVVDEAVAMVQKSGTSGWRGLLVMERLVRKSEAFRQEFFGRDLMELVQSVVGVRPRAESRRLKVKTKFLELVSLWSTRHGAEFGELVVLKNYVEHMKLEDPIKSRTISTLRESRNREECKRRQTILDQGRKRLLDLEKEIRSKMPGIKEAVTSLCSLFLAAFPTYEEPSSDPGPTLSQVIDEGLATTSYKLEIRINPGALGNLGENVKDAIKEHYRPIGRVYWKLMNRWIRLLVRYQHLDKHRCSVLLQETIPVYTQLDNLQAKAAVLGLDDPTPLVEDEFVEVDCEFREPEPPPDPEHLDPVEIGPSTEPRVYDCITRTWCCERNCAHVRHNLRSELLKKAPVLSLDKIQDLDRPADCPAVDDGLHRLWNWSFSRD